MKVKHILLLTIFLLTTLLSCKKENANNITNKDNKSTIAATPEVITAYIVVIKANSDTAKSDVVQVNY